MIHWRRAALTAALVATQPLAAPPAPAEVEATVEQPRPYGHVVGDVLTQRVLLQRDGRDFEPDALPAAGRVGVWLERRTPRILTARDGRRWLSVDYQLINSPQALRVVTLPAWQLKGRDGSSALAVGEWYLSVAPLTPRNSFNQGPLSELLPDRPPPLVATDPMRRRIALWTGASILMLAAWLAWWAWRRRRSADLPFSQARREIDRLEPDGAQAWQALHRAFDRTAGMSIHAGTLPALFRRAPHLAAMRGEIETFYRESQARFFADAGAVASLSARRLCDALRRLERRHER
jgi:mxaA protein